MTNPAGSKRIDAKGYVLVKVVDHQEFGTGYFKEHHVVWFDNTGTRVESGFVIHHKDECKTNNDFENLKLMSENEHNRHHRKTGTPWNKGKTGVYSEEHKEKLRKANSERNWKESSKRKVADFAKTRTDLKRDQKGKFTTTKEK